MADDDDTTTTVLILGGLAVAAWVLLRGLGGAIGKGTGSAIGGGLGGGTERALPGRVTHERAADGSRLRVQLWNTADPFKKQASDQLTKTIEGEPAATRETAAKLVRDLDWAFAYLQPSPGSTMGEHELLEGAFGRWGVKYYSEPPR